jgi:RNA polymerase sigma-70 factor, ECF subfamily
MMPVNVVEMHPENQRSVSDATDEELMQRYGLGDIPAFEELFARHKNSVYAFIRGFYPVETAWDDIFQTVFWRILRARKTYKPTAKFTTWLFTVTRSVCIDAMRGARRTNVVSLHRTTEDNPAAGFPEPASVIPNARETMYQTELQEAIMHIVHTLPDDQREILLLREKTDLTFADIAAMIGCSANTVKSRMHYALLTLRRGLQERGFESL